MGDLKRSWHRARSSFLDAVGLSAPDVPKPPVIPMPDEEAIVRARRRKIAQRTGGRDSTILADSNDTFGP
jgi:hypothetical protein